jgi:hypothetical protein
MGHDGPSVFAALHRNLHGPFPLLKGHVVSVTRQAANVEPLDLFLPQRPCQSEKGFLIKVVVCIAGGCDGWNDSPEAGSGLVHFSTLLILFYLCSI